MMSKAENARLFFAVCKKLGLNPESQYPRCILTPSFRPASSYFDLVADTHRIATLVTPGSAELMVRVWHENPFFDGIVISFWLGEKGGLQFKAAIIQPDESTFPDQPIEPKWQRWCVNATRAMVRGLARPAPAKL